ncbi:hypothetical protein F8388_002712 [Cannabis sativa]|uniref:Uncharacterized protein n=1 Tax=Cannabis sativa TaxID=3483 RepID=A0A7J6DRX3_CANSA|nr:hypothetical protein F8388_002712 [Cannabis sativa]KAF4374413.1 hypothetical protein G4B88_026300 [Cannabis sativa]
MMYAAPLAVMKLYSAVPYLATLINYLVWTLYGLPFIHPGSILVLTINGSGLKKTIRVVLVVLAELVFISILTLLTLTLTHSH